jgi:FtsZ-interacting cell division protein ZipA
MPDEKIFAATQKRKGNGMQTVIIVLVVAVVALVALVAVATWFLSRRQRSSRLHERFGPEYEHTVRQVGDRGKAEQELQSRQERVEQLHIRPLSDEERARFAEAWGSAQAQFVDDPGGTIRQADRLVGEAMQARGYPVGQFEQRAADISVDHPDVVSNYRAAHALAARSEHGEVSTDELRQGLLHYCALFDELLEGAAVGRTTRTAARR